MNSSGGITYFQDPIEYKAMMQWLHAFDQDR